MRLNELLSSIRGDQYNMKESEITSLEFDSRKVKHGSLFIALEGAQFDGHDFIVDAIERGAVAVVTQKKMAIEIPQIVVGNTRETMAKLAKRFYGGFDDMHMIGITGTNGKTTTSFLIHSILETAGMHPGLIGTIYYIGETKVKAERTTPESLVLFGLLNQFKRGGAKAVVMEVSSHALSLERVNEIQFQTVVFTNLSQDHLDFHKTMNDYKAAKMRIFSLLDEDGCAVFNIDDAISKSIQCLNLKNTLTYGLKNRGDVWADIISDSIDGIHAQVRYRDQKYKVNSHLIGDFNIYNILAAFATGVAMGLDIDVIITGLEKLQGVKGRVERVVDNVFVDFAHTPSALENVLKSLRQYVPRKLLVVFGCGGDRDRAKRPKMGAVASRLADFVIVTSDNPRSEPPAQIIKDIENGITSTHYTIIEDRREAIRYALALKKENDILLVAGKGHEEYQMIDDKTLEFSDAEVIRACFESL